MANKIDSGNNNDLYLHAPQTENNSSCEGNINVSAARVASSPSMNVRHLTDTLHRREIKVNCGFISEHHNKYHYKNNRKTGKTKL